MADGSHRPFTISSYILSGCDHRPGAPAAVLIFEELGTAEEAAEVTALVSHELRTPLTVLHTSLQMARRLLAGGDTDRARSYVDDALTEARLHGGRLEAASAQGQGSTF
ncbi:MAG TPA: histidine kinase dimerization/phospho-acceptor domain-containing protein, partial [Chloroflexota bacterium]